MKRVGDPSLSTLWRLNWDLNTDSFPGSARGKRTHLPMQETQVQSLGQEDLLEEDLTTHTSILAWRIPWTGEPGWLWSMESQRIGHDWSNWASTDAVGFQKPGSEVLWSTSSLKGGGIFYSFTNYKMLPECQKGPWSLLLQLGHVGRAGFELIYSNRGLPR